MSKLKLFALATIGLTLSTAAYLLARPGSSNNVAYTVDPELAWGKANAPVLVRIEEIEKTDSTVTLKGFIRSKISDLQVEWKLPEGAYVVDGETEKSASLDSNNAYSGETITINVANAEDAPIVFSAFTEKDGERMGHNLIYKWNVSEQETRHVEKIRSMMKARKVRLVR